MTRWFVRDLCSRKSCEVEVASGWLVISEGNGFSASGWEEVARVERKVSVWATRGESKGGQGRVELRRSDEQRSGEWGENRRVGGKGWTRGGEEFKIGVGGKGLWKVDVRCEGDRYGGRKEEDEKNGGQDNEK